MERPGSRRGGHAPGPLQGGPILAALGLEPGAGIRPAHRRRRDWRAADQRLPMGEPWHWTGGRDGRRPAFLRRLLALRRLTDPRRRANHHRRITGLVPRHRVPTLVSVRYDVRMASRQLEHESSPLHGYPDPAPAERAVRSARRPPTARFAWRVEQIAYRRRAGRISRRARFLRRRRVEHTGVTHLVRGG